MSDELGTWNAADAMRHYEEDRRKVRSEKITAAAAGIAKILCALEIDLGEIVDDVMIKDMDISTHDSGPERLRQVHIRMAQRPGSRWA